MLIFVFLVTDEHEVYFTTWFTGRIRFLFIYYTVSPYNRTKEISKNGNGFPRFLRKNGFEGVSGSHALQRFGRESIEGRRKVHFTFPPSSAFLKVFEETFVFSESLPSDADFFVFQEQVPFPRHFAG